jgi:hypothetical protein
VSVLVEQLSADAGVPLRRTLTFELDSGTFWKDVKATVFRPVVQVLVNVAGAAAMVFLPATAPILFPVLATYNSIQSVDQLVDLHRKGNLTARDVGVNAAQIALNFIPYAGTLKRVQSAGKAALYTIDGLVIGGQAVLMTLEGVEQVRRLRERDIGKIAELDEWVRETARTNPSHPDLARRKADLARLVEETRNRGVEMFQEMARQGAMMVLPAVALGQISRRLTASRVRGLIDEGHFVDRPGEKPRYDPTSGRMYGDAARITAAELAALQKAHGAHGALRLGEIANVLGTDAVTVTRKRGAITVEKQADGGYLVNAPPEAALADVLDEAWRVRSREPGAPPERPARVAAELEPTWSAAEVRTRQNVAVGNRIDDLAEATAILRRLADGDASALRLLGVEPPPGFDPRLVEWGLGQTVDKSYVIIRGEPGAVSWETFRNVRPIAHTHPLRPDKLLRGADARGGVALADILAGGEEQQRNKVDLLPSAADIRFSAEHGLPEHTVHTPYVSVGEGLVGNPTPGGSAPRIDFRILGAKRVGTFGEGIGVYRCTIEGTAGGKRILRREVWAIDHPEAGSILELEAPAGLVRERAAPAEKTKVTGAGEPEIERTARVEAERLVAEATQAADGVTSVLRDVSERHGTPLVGLDKRLKAAASLARKLRDRAAQRTGKRSDADKVRAEAAKVNDALRFTMILPRERYRALSEAIKADLGARGFRVEKQYDAWALAGTEHEASYRGVNVTVRSPGGQILELQFHTTESFQVKTELHPLYEITRDPTAPPDRKAEAEATMRERWRTVAAPE